VNCRIVKCSSKVLAPRIVRRYALSKGSAKGPQGVRNAYCNCSGGCFGSRGASSEGSNQACRRTRIKGSSKVLALYRPTSSIKRSWHSQCIRGKGPNKPKVS
jgi:hypothetical protein